VNPVLGIFYHAIGGLAAASFYIPFKKVKNWSWETYWLLGGLFSWIFAPWLVSFITIPDIFDLLSSIPINNLVWPFIFGMIWGIGGLTFGLSMRYLGMSLGYALSLGITAAFGTLIPPIYFGQFAELVSNLSGWVTLGGVFISFVGIAVTGKAGIRKDSELSENEKKENIKEFNLKKGAIFSLLAGIMSASFAFGIAAGKPIAAKAAELGAPELFVNSPVFILIMGGGFVTNLIYCLFLGFRNKTVKEFVNSNNPDYLKNYFFSALAGIIWYLQFMFYGMGTTQMGEYDFSSWSIHMSFIIVFSNMWGLFFNEWTNSSKLTKNYILSGLVILIISTFIIGVGNYLHN